ncbi:MAG: PAS/PAC sensor hybrid histidine kinase, partial [uncultured Blastococcus sp.]
GSRSLIGARRWRPLRRRWRSGPADGGPRLGRHAGGAGRELAGRPAVRRPHAARVEVPHGADLGAGLHPVLQRRLRALHRREAPGHRRGHPDHPRRGVGRARAADRARHVHPGGVVAARPPPAAGARRVPRGDLLHRLARARLRRRRRGRRHARGVHRDDRSDPRRAPAAAPPRPGDRRQPARRRARDGGGDVPRPGGRRAGPAVRRRVPVRPGRARVPPRRGRRLRRRPAARDGRGRVGPERGPRRARHPRRPLRRPGHRRRRPPPHRRARHRATGPAAGRPEPEPRAGRGLPVLLRARGGPVRRGGGQHPRLRDRTPARGVPGRARPREDDVLRGREPRAAHTADAAARPHRRRPGQHRRPGSGRRAGAAGAGPAQRP